MDIKVMRPGKTAKDRAGGRFQKNMENKLLRDYWRESVKNAAGSRNSFNNLNDKFPRHTCNGKKNRFFK